MTDTSERLSSGEESGSSWQDGAGSSVAASVDTSEEEGADRSTVVPVTGGFEVEDLQQMVPDLPRLNEVTTSSISERGW
ncbi:hypothetical protein F0562_003450 [Nyssa sinensis]|uniref:Uncharacterized protein n=1 Tax=Nyssa sinensis TaxID=561372 RepID=A0A5J5C0N3_9ASTE|nr:hypothetical protein F0562_003450 [Nyssa sinensis]